MGEFIRNPVRYFQRNVDPRIVVSSMAATAAIGVTVMVMRKSGVRLLRQTASVVKGG